MGYRKRLPRRPMRGMMLHIDGIEHRWFGDERRYELIVVLDDATSEIYYAQLVEAESIRSVVAWRRGTSKPPSGRTVWQVGTRALMNMRLCLQNLGVYRFVPGLLDRKQVEPAPCSTVRPWVGPRVASQPTPKACAGNPDI